MPKLLPSLTDTVDIGLPPWEALSNFMAYSFVFRGFPCASMEGLLQSFKFPLIEKQQRVMQLVGLKAKRKGQKKKWYLDHLLYWQGEPMCRYGETYQILIKEAFTALFAQNKDFREELLSTGNARLIHSIGKQSKKYTILTECEFTSILEGLRQQNRQK